MDNKIEKTDWIIPANPKVYDTVRAFRELGTLDWHKSRMLKSIQVGEIAYIYISGAMKRVKFKCVVTKEDVQGLEINDYDYYTDKSKATTDGSFVELKMIEEYPDSSYFSLDNLRRNGIKGNIQCCQRIEQSVSDYIENTYRYNSSK